MDVGPFPRLFVLDFLSDQEKIALKPADDSKGVANAADAGRGHISTISEVTCMHSTDICS